MKSLTYLIYIVAWEAMVLGGAYYAVFILERSGWWFLLAVLLSGAAYKPQHWIYEPKELPAVCQSKQST